MPTSEGRITVQVSLRSVLRKYRPDPNDRRPFPVELPAGSTVGDLVTRLGVEPRLAKLIFIDHIRCNGDTPLRDGARVDIFPPIAGG